MIFLFPRWDMLIPWRVVEDFLLWKFLLGGFFGGWGLFRELAGLMIDGYYWDIFFLMVGLCQKGIVGREMNNWWWWWWWWWWWGVSFPTSSQMVPVGVNICWDVCQQRISTHSVWWNSGVYLGCSCWNQAPKGSWCKRWDVSARIFLKEIHC